MITAVLIEYRNMDVLHSIFHIDNDKPYHFILYYYYHYLISIHLILLLAYILIGKVMLSIY